MAHADDGVPGLGPVLAAVRFVERHLVALHEQIAHLVAGAQLARARALREGGLLPPQVVRDREGKVRLLNRIIRRVPGELAQGVVQDLERLLAHGAKGTVPVDLVQPVEDFLEGRVHVLNLVTATHDKVLDATLEHAPSSPL